MIAPVKSPHMFHDESPQVGECLHPHQLLLGAEHRRLAQLVTRPGSAGKRRDVFWCW